MNHFRTPARVGLRQLALGHLLALLLFPGAWLSAFAVDEDDDPGAKAILFSDSLDGRRQLPTSGNVVGSNTWATREKDEPRHGGKRGGHSIWFGFKAPSDGSMVLSTAGSRFDTILGVYRVDPAVKAGGFAALVPVAFGDDTVAGDMTSKLVIPVHTDWEYAIVIDGFAGASGEVALAWLFVQRLALPPSVLWTSPSRSVSTGDRVELSTRLADAVGAELRWMREDGEVIGDGAGTATWVMSSFTAADVGRYRLRVRSGDLEIFSDWIELQLNSDADEVAGARDKMFDALESPLRAEVVPTTWRAPSGGAAVRRSGARLQSAPGGVVRGLNGTQIFNTVGATRDPDEPLHCGEAGGASYWFAYEAAEAGVLHFDSQGTAFPAIVAVYTFDGSLESYAQLQPVACDVADQLPASVDFRTTPGRTYLVVLDGVGGTRGVAQLNYRFSPDTAPVVIRSPASVTLNEGQPLVLSAETIGTAPLTMVWRRDGVAIPGAASPIYQVPSVTSADGGSYRLEISNSLGAATSAVAVVVVRVPPTILTPLQNLSVSPGAPASFVAQVTGSAPLSFRWFRDGLELPGQTLSSLSFAATGSADVGSYHFVVSNVVGAVTSTVARLDIGRAPTLNGIFTDRWIEQGVRTTITAPVDGTEPMTVRWFRFGAEVPGQNGRVLVLESPTAADSGSYSFTASNAAGALSSVPAWFEVVRRPQLVQPLRDQQVAKGSELVLTAEVQGDGPLTFLWYHDDVLLPGQSGAVLRVVGAGATDAGLYRFDALNPVGLVSSPPARVEVWVPPSAVVAPERVRRPRGAGIELTASLGGDGPFSLQWYRRGVPIPGATEETLTLAALTEGDTGEYRLHVANAVAVYTNAFAMLEVVPPPTVVLSPESSAVRVGAEVEFVATVEGAEALTYRWFHNGSRVDGVDAPLLALPAARFTDEGEYWVEVETDLGLFTSERGVLRVLEPVQWVTLPPGQEVAVGSDVSFRAEASGTGPLVWTWRKDGQLLDGRTNGVLQLQSVGPEAAGTYRVTVGNGTSSIESGPISLVVVREPRIVRAPVAQRVGRGGRARFSVQSDSAGATRFAWIKDGQVIEGASGAELVVEDCDALDAGVYSAEVENLAGSTRSSGVRLEVREQSGIWFEPENGRVVVGLLVPRGLAYRLETAPGAGGPWTLVVDGVGTESGLAEFPFPVGATTSQVFRYGFVGGGTGR